MRHAVRHASASHTRAGEIPVEGLHHGYNVPSWLADDSIASNQPARELKQNSVEALAVVLVLVRSIWYGPGET